MDHDLAIWANIKSRHRWCSLRPCPCVVWCPPGFRIPRLFLIFINDLPDNINSTARLFADDCVLYRNIRRSEDQQILHDDLNILAQWEEAWLMKSYVAKCHSMRVTKHSLPKQITHDYSLHNQVSENVLSAKYLGILSQMTSTGVNTLTMLPIRQLGHWVSYAET